MENKEDIIPEEDIITVIDDDGKEFYFEELDRIETADGKKYVAMLPLDEDEDDEEGGVLILEVLEENGESYLAEIEDENVFEEIGNIFEDRLIANLEEDQYE